MSCFNCCSYCSDTEPSCFAVQDIENIWVVTFLENLQIKYMEKIKSETYYEPCQTSKMEYFGKIVKVS